MGFQDSASPTFEGMQELHDSIFFYLVVIGIGVAWILGSVFSFFASSRAPISHRYYNHGTLIELVWTVTPALVLIAIAFPSFKLLYLMDIQGLIAGEVCCLAGVALKALSRTDCVALKRSRPNRNSSKYELYDHCAKSCGFAMDTNTATYWSHAGRRSPGHVMHIHYALLCL